ncbi:hypothetical protein K488DRAFT_81870 [Vararia minispora EC-137]|uniref:Uncharacterized protein n=1 Tax=Vararia minispora EC-137 TaxID=1314806 RepID=A0ACB8QXS0_9AGAM|nr:hypothetical protein K488DRAFT_81870 [Vararia minispora EC-137]
MPVRRLWELYGGVWGRDIDDKTFQFTQFPSKIREIKLREWTVSVNMYVRDFSFDPSQDLVVFIEEIEGRAPDSIGRCRIHLRSLSNGEKHPSAKESELQFPSDVHQFMGSTYTIRICDEYLGVVRHKGDIAELAAWKWKTSKLCLRLSGKNSIRAFTFLTDSSVIVASLVTPTLSNEREKTHTSLIVYDLTETQATAPKNDDTQFSAVMRLLDIPVEDESVELSIYSDPSPCRPGHSGPDVPFRTPDQDRLLILNFEVFLGLSTSSRTFVVTFKDLQDGVTTCIGSTSANRICEREEWGPNSLVEIQNHLSWAPWVCSVYGLRYARHRIQIAGDDGRRHMCVILEDYCPQRARRAILEDGESPVPSLRTPATISMHEMPLPVDLQRIAHELKIMISEDSIIALEGQDTDRKMHLFTF